MEDALDSNIFYYVINENEKYATEILKKYTGCVHVIYGEINPNTVLLGTSNNDREEKFPIFDDASKDITLPTSILDCLDERCNYNKIKNLTLKI